MRLLHRKIKAVLNRRVTGSTRRHPTRPEACLLGLPAEVRHQIYDYVYPENMLHMARLESFRPGKPDQHIAYWCLEKRYELHAHKHRACSWLKSPKKHMLGLPLTCKKLYEETIHRVYSRHHFHFYYEKLALEWFCKTPEVYHAAVRSITITAMTFSRQSPEPYTETWAYLATLSSLQYLRVFITSDDHHDMWQSSQSDMARPILEVQQESIQQFDVVFDMSLAWLPPALSNTIVQNRLTWDAFSIDVAGYAVFQGLHPKCRLIAINGTLISRPIHDTLPTAKDVFRWLNWFTSGEAQENLGLEGYHLFMELGAEAEAAQTDTRDRRDEGMKLQAKLEKMYVYPSEHSDDPEKWDLEVINHAATLLEGPASSWLQSRWVYPERPSWAKDKEL